MEFLSLKWEKINKNKKGIDWNLQGFPVPFPTDGKDRDSCALLVKYLQLGS